MTTFSGFVIVTWDYLLNLWHSYLFRCVILCDRAYEYSPGQGYELQKRVSQETKFMKFLN